MIAHRVHRSRRGRAPSRPFRAVLEPLESRALLATVSWTAATSGFWDDGANWNNGVGPANGDTVIINPADASVTVTYRGMGANAIRALTVGSNDLLAIQTGTSLQWLGGLWQGGGLVSVEAGGTLELAGPETKLLGSITINNVGTLLWTDGNVNVDRGSPALINDTLATFEVRTDTDITRTGGSLVVTNRGTWIKTAGTGETTINPTGTRIDNFGLIEAQTGVLGFNTAYTQSGSTAAEVRLDGGGFRFGQLATITLGSLTGEGTVNGTLANRGGTTAPGGSDIGVLQFIGNYGQFATDPNNPARLAIQIGGTTPGTQFDQLLVQPSATPGSGILALGGALDVTLVNGFNPSLGDRFVILRGIVEGRFDATNLPTLPSGQFWFVDYQADSVALEVVSSLADLVVTKQATPSNPSVNDVITYTIGVTNNGPLGADAVVVVDTLPAGVTFLPDASTPGLTFNASNNTVTGSLGFLAVGASGTITIAVQATPAVGGTIIVNTATATSDAPDPDTTSNTATVSTPVAGVSGLSLTKIGPNTTAVGRTFVYQLIVTNNGPNAATNVQIFDVLPRNVLLSDAGSSPGLTLNLATRTVTASLGTIAVGQSVTVRVAVTPTLATSGRILVNRAQVTAAEQTGTLDAVKRTRVLRAPEVIGLARFGIHSRPSYLVVRFDRAMNEASVENVRNYKVTTPGPDHRLGTRDDRTARVLRAVYDAPNKRVILVVDQALGVGQLRIRAKGVLSAQGVQLAGNGSGYPGFDYVQRFGPQNLQGNAHALARLLKAQGVSARVRADVLILAPADLHTAPAKPRPVRRA
jgi:uncharacterized repeat protein (TIGR01451 family)